MRVLDVEAAFINGGLDEEIFMKLPEGFETILAEIAESLQEEIVGGYMTNDNTCIWLGKVMYGLVQAA